MDRFLFQLKFHQKTDKEEILMNAWADEKEVNMLI
jgi:hypothetical protein